jgi:hypothetical protein
MAVATRERVDSPQWFRCNDGDEANNTYQTRSRIAIVPPGYALHSIEPEAVDEIVPGSRSEYCSRCSRVDQFTTSCRTIVRVPVPEVAVTFRL